jgi:hypothetical protein
MLGRPSWTASAADGPDIAAGRPATASSSHSEYAAANVTDGDQSSYWQSAGSMLPQWVQADIGSTTGVDEVVLKLPSGWESRTQTLSVQGSADGTSFSTLKSSAAYTFAPGSANTVSVSFPSARARYVRVHITANTGWQAAQLSALEVRAADGSSGNLARGRTLTASSHTEVYSGGNTVTVPLDARLADVQLRFTSNTGATAGQIAEFQVLGVPAPNPDLSITSVSASPVSPVESDEITLSATVRNSGPSAAPASAVALRLGDTKVATAQAGPLAAGAQTTVSASIGTREAGSYQLSAVADEANAVIEQNETDNTYTSPTALVVKPVASSDLVAASVSTSPSSPAAGDSVTFSVAVRNQGTTASAGGSHGLTLALVDSRGATVRTLTAADGSYTLRVTVAADAHELPVKRGNNTSTQAFFVGRGADLPFDMYEAEDGTAGGGAQVVGPNRTVGDIAGEASGRKAVTLDSTGEYVEFTSRASTNTLVTRFSIPDAPGGGGIDATLNVYVDGVFRKAIELTSKYAWLYGAEASPGNSPGAGAPRHIYDEAHIMLGGTVPAGSTIRLQKDAANTSSYAIDFINLEQVAPVANPDPASYAVPAGFTHQDVQNALDRVRMDTSGKLVGVYLPAGDYQTSSKFQVYGKAVQVTGAGPWFTKFHAPSTQDNTDIGFRAEASAKGSSFRNFSYFGNYTSRIDGPGKVFDFSNVSDIVIDNIWNEHMVCLYWGANTDRITVKNSRIRNMFADGINMTNGSTDNLVSNNEARATGDDSFALFSAIDAGGADMKNNVYENLTSILTWRAAGIAVYGGYDNTFRNIHIADTLVYSGITISSLDFGYPMNGFGTGPTTVENVSVVRAGGHFWGAQTFPGIWLFSADKVFQGIRVNNVDIVDPTYSGIMFQTKYEGGQPEFPIKDTVFTDISISGARKSGDAFDAKSGFGLWANEMPESGQGPAVGEVTFNGLRLSGNAQDIRNTTSTFKININP